MRPSAARPLSSAADPLNALGIEPVGRLVEDHGRRVAEQRRGHAETLAHAEREGSDALARDLAETDELDHLFDAAAWNAVRLREREQVVVGRAAGVDRVGLEHRADLVQRRRQLAVDAAVDRGLAAGGRVQPEDQAHRRRLARPVGSEKAGHDARTHLEGQIVDG